MIAVAVAPRRGGDGHHRAPTWLATGQLATMNTTEPSSQLVTLITER